jgi:hypothetical protein
VIAGYLREHAGAVPDGPYVSLSLEVNFRWDWRGDDRKPRFYANPTTHVAGLLAQRPDARVLVTGGYFDLSTPLSASMYAIAHAGLPRDRVRILPLVAGHSLDAATLPAAAAALRQFIETGGNA